MTISVDDVCTDTDLEKEVGGPAQLAELIPAHWENSAEQARQSALDDVLSALGSRRPPLFESDLADVTELRSAVKYGALMRLYRFAKTTGDDVFASHHKDFTKLWSSALANLNPTTLGGEAAAPHSIAFHRR